MVLWQFRDRLIRQYDQSFKTSGATFATALLPHLNGDSLRRLQDSMGFACMAAEPSRTLAVLRSGFFR